MTVGDVANLIVALAATGSLLYISRQVNVTRKQTKGQFLLALDDQIEKSLGIGVRLLNEQAFTPAGAEWVEVWKLMGVFERINIMVEDRILDVALVDRLYGFLMIALIANDDIFMRVEASGAEWQDFIDLCYAVANRRQHAKAAARDAAFIERVHKLSKKTRRTSTPFRI